MAEQNASTVNLFRHLSGRKIATFVFVCVIAGNFLFFSLIAHYEPVADDGWYHVYFLEKNVNNRPDLSYLVANIQKFYMEGNPRIGQVFTNLNYWPYHFHEILTPSMIMLLFFGIFVLALGRLPKPSDFYDSFLFLVVMAFCWLSLPDVGVAFFSRPIAGNYTFGACIQLLFFIPLRLWVHQPAKPFYKFSFCAFMFLAGAVAGMANEHTGPIAIFAYAFTAIHTALTRDRRLPSWAVAGWMGLVSGYLALFLAPGQTKRYSGLATKTTLMENITARGWEGNLEIVGGFTIMVLPLLVAVSAMAYLFLISDVRNARGMETIDSRRRFLEVGFLTVCAFGIVATTLASPLTGPRLFIAPMAVLVIAGVIVTNIVSRPKKLMWLFLVGAIVINIVYLSRVYVVYSTVNRESRERLELLKGAPRGSAVRVPRLSYTKRSRIYIGDDLAKKSRQVLAARYFGLERIDSYPRPTTSPDS